MFTKTNVSKRLCYQSGANIPQEPIFYLTLKRPLNFYVCSFYYRSIPLKWCVFKILHCAHSESLIVEAETNFAKCFIGLSDAGLSDKQQFPQET